MGRKCRGGREGNPPTLRLDSASSVLVYCPFYHNPQHLSTLEQVSGPGSGVPACAVFRLLPRLPSLIGEEKFFRKPLDRDKLL